MLKQTKLIKKKLKMSLLQKTKKFKPKLQKIQEIDPNLEESEQKIDSNQDDTKIITQNQSNEVHFNAQLTKILEPYFELLPIYTGGKNDISYDEEHFFGSVNFKIVKVNLQTKQIVDRISHENEEIANFALHPSDKMIATFTKNFMLRLVNQESKDIIKFWKIQDHFPLDMQFEKQGKYLGAGCVNGFIKIFDCHKGTETHSYKIHKGAVTKIMFHPNPMKLILVSTGDDFAIRIYDLVVSSCLQSFIIHESQVSSLIFTDNGTNLISAGADKRIVIWDFVNMTFQAQIEYDDEIFAMNFIKVMEKNKKKMEEKNYLIVAGMSGLIKTIDITSNDISIKEFPEHTSHEILKIMHLKTRNQIVTVTNDQNIMFYDVIQGPQLVLKDMLVGYNDQITEAKFKKMKNNYFDMDEQYIVMSTNSHIMKYIDLKTKNISLIKGHKEIVLTLDLYEDFMISSGKDKVIKLWKKVNGSPSFDILATYSGHLEAVNYINFAPKTANMFVSCSSDKNIKTWDLEQFTLKQSRNKSEAPVNITQSKRTVFAHDQDINVVKFSPNEKLIASCSQDKKIKIWNSKTLATQMVLSGHKRGVWDIAFSPIEQILASASGDLTIKLWNLLDGQIINTFEGHLSSVLKVIWVCHGLELLSAGGDGLIKLWNISKGTCVNTFEKHEGRIWAFDNSNYMQDGKSLILSGGSDSILTIWEDKTQEHEQDKRAEQHRLLIEQQTFQSFMYEKNYIEAAKLAFQQNFIKCFHQAIDALFAQRVFTSELIFTETQIQIKQQESADDSEIHDLLYFLINDNFSKLITIIRDMNSTQRQCVVAQKLLNLIFKNIDIDEFNQMGKDFKVLSKEKQLEKGDFKKILDQLLVYSERHYERSQRFLKNSYLLDYIIKKIDYLEIKND